MNEPQSSGRTNRRLILALGAAVVITAAAVAVMLGVGVPGGAGPPAASAGATVPPVAVVAEVVADGFAVPARTAELAAEAGGTIAEVPVALGSAVRAGDTLVRLDGAALRSELDGARAATDAATARAAQARALETQAREGVTVAAANLDRADAALATARDRNAGEDEAVAARNAARAQLRAARAAATGATEAANAADADVVRAGAAVAGLELALDRLTIRAPFAGVVASLPARVGATAAPGQVLVRVGDPSAWEFVSRELDESGIARVAVGARAVVTLDGLPDVRLEGTVARAGAYGESRQGGIVYEVVVVPSGEVPDGVRWNMTATIAIEVGG